MTPAELAAKVKEIDEALRTAMLMTAPYPHYRGICEECQEARLTLREVMREWPIHVDFVQGEPQMNTSHLVHDNYAYRDAILAALPPLEAK